MADPLQQEMDGPPSPPPAEGAPQIVVGPVQRFRDARGNVTVFLETDRPCEVRVDTEGRGGATHRMRTWAVHGHHYALVMLEDVPADRAVPYRVWLDDAPVWPDPDRDDPVSVFPPAVTGDLARVAFGSCRELGPHDAEGLAAWGADALVGLADRLRHLDHGEWPHLVLHLGDQVYADEPPEEVRKRLRELHAGDPEEIREEIHDFEEYTWLYRTTWMHPDVRWLLSTVPSAMILDDHDLRDDWNTSAAWRREMEARPWWHDRVVGALGSYWVYQHIGNISPEVLRDDPTFRAITTAPEAEATGLLDDLAQRSEDDPWSPGWSFARELGPARLVVLDSRCRRVLEPPEMRAIVDDAEWAWLRDTIATQPAARHLLIATTLPVFLPYGVHHIEGWSEAVATGAWGRLWARLGERIRRAVDLEHWPAYHRSFVGVAQLLREVVTGTHPPASILFLSGDVHFSYTAQVDLPGIDAPETAIHQLVQSPMRNRLPKAMIATFWLLQTRFAAVALRPLPRLAGVEDPRVTWRFNGPLTFKNGLMTVLVDGERADVAVDRAMVDGEHERLVRTEVKLLTSGG